MKNDTRSFYEASVRRAVEQILAQLDDALDLSALAKAAGLSPLHFHRIFKGLVGETPLELHRRLRLERAAHQLSQGEAAVTRIAFDAGYETHESFTRAFGDRYGCSPSLFRQSAAETRQGCARPPQIELAARSALHFRPGGSADVLVFAFPETGGFVMKVDLKELSELRVAAVHHVGPYDRISEAFARLGELAGPAGLIRPGAEMLAIYHDDPESKPASDLSSDASITVPRDVALPSGLSELKVPAGRYACTTYVGPYTGLGDAWARFMGGWLPNSGHRIGNGPAFEIYRNTPADTPPSELRTELYLSVA